MYVCKRLAAAQRPVLLPAAPLRQLSKAIECRGGTVLLRTLLPGRYGGQKYSGGAKSKARSARDERQMMRGKTFYGGQKEARCPHTAIGLRKFTGMRCLTNKGQARQGFDACRAVSLYEGHEEKAASPQSTRKFSKRVLTLTLRNGLY